MGACSRHFVPGYDHAVPPGRNTFRAEALIKLALMGFSLSYPKNGRPVGAKRKRDPADN